MTSDINGSSVAKNNARDAKSSGEVRARKFRLAIMTLYEKTGGKAWEPRVHSNEFIEWAIAEGYLRRVDGRCGFEAFRDAMLSWTDAAHTALADGASEPQPQDQQVPQPIREETK